MDKCKPEMIACRKLSDMPSAWEEEILRASVQVSVGWMGAGLQGVGPEM